MDATNAAPVAERIAKALENTQEQDFYRLSSLGEALAALAAQIPTAKQTQLAAVSFLLLRPDGDQVRTTLTNVYSLLTTNELIEVLKWPFCVGEAQKLVLTELEKRTPRKFGGDVWKFVEQVNSPGIPGFDAHSLELPPKRPQITDAIAELQHLTQAAAKQP